MIIVGWLAVGGSCRCYYGGGGRHPEKQQAETYSAMHKTSGKEVCIKHETLSAEPQRRDQCERW